MVSKVSNVQRYIKSKLFWKNRPILKFVGEGCQSMESFMWVGVVIGSNWDFDNNWAEVVIKIVRHNHAHTDSRDSKEPELYTYPLMNGNIQDVDSVLILFAM